MPPQLSCSSLILNGERAKNGNYGYCVKSDRHNETEAGLCVGLNRIPFGKVDVPRILVWMHREVNYHRGARDVQLAIYRSSRAGRGAPNNGMQRTRKSAALLSSKFRARR